jgi:SAM-dependent methyltransferase
VGGAERLDMLEEASFDVVVCNMALMDIENAAGAISETARVLRLGGRLVASLSHPCFDIPNASAWVVERIDLTTTIWRKVSRYREFFMGLCPWRVGPSQIVHTPAYHRPLSWYFHSFRAAGFVVTMLAEPEPADEFVADEPQGRWIALIPLHCVIEARRDR